MGYVLKTNLAHPSNYCRNRLTGIEYIVIHYTGNDGDTAARNAEYFHSNIVKASAHYFVDDTTVVRTVPDDCVAWSVGGNKYSDCNRTGGGKYYKVATNANTLNIELCDTVRDGVIEPTEETLANAVALVRELMATYGVPFANVIRHFDVNGKHCPEYFMDDAKWNAWKQRLTDCECSFVVQVSIDNLNIRTEPSMQSTVTGQTGKGLFTIVETCGNWGLLKAYSDTRDGWIWLGNPNYCAIIKQERG